MLRQCIFRNLPFRIAVLGRLLWSILGGQGYLEIRDSHLDYPISSSEARATHVLFTFESTLKRVVVTERESRFHSIGGVMSMTPYFSASDHNERIYEGKSWSIQL